MKMDRVFHLGIVNETDNSLCLEGLVCGGMVIEGWGYSSPVPTGTMNVGPGAMPS